MFFIGLFCGIVMMLPVIVIGVAAAYWRQKADLLLREPNR